MENGTINKNSGSDTKSTLQLLHEAKTQKVAKEFESIFTSMMLKSMRSTLQASEDSLMPDSMGQKIFTEMLDNEYGKMMNTHSSTGIAEMVLKELQKNDTDETTPSLNMLNGLKTQSWQLDKQFTPARQTSSGSQDTLHNIAKWESYINEAGTTYNVDPKLIAAVISKESGGNPDALSSKGAKGLMQLMDSTASDMGALDSYNPLENIMAGTKYLKQMLDMHNGDEKLALASYNAGPAAVNHYQGVPPYAETQQYVDSVLSLKNKIPETSFTSIKGSNNGNTGN
jgi:Rod binding domain-containing protein